MGRAATKAALSRGGVVAGAPGPAVPLCAEAATCADAPPEQRQTALKLFLSHSEKQRAELALGELAAGAKGRRRDAAAMPRRRHKLSC